MKFMMIVKASQESEAGQLPSRHDFEVMGKYNEELVKAGVLRDAAGLQPTSKGTRLTWRGGKPQVTDGPFAETKELIAGYWLIEVGSRDEALEWARRIPFDQMSAPDRPAGVEVRQLFDIGDFPDVPPAVAELEEKLARGRANAAK